MKLTDLIWRARKPQQHADEIEAAGRLAANFGNRPGSDMTDRSSMADLVRLLKEVDDAQTGSVRQPL
jgi:hypothetical protein